MLPNMKRLAGVLVKSVPSYVKMSYVIGRYIFLSSFFVLFRWRRKGGKLLLSKYMLLFIVVLNIIDCTLVLGELILDLHHVKGIHFTAYLSEIKQSKIGFLIGCNFVGRGLNFLFHKRIIIIPDSVCP